MRPGPGTSTRRCCRSLSRCSAVSTPEPWARAPNSPVGPKRYENRDRPRNQRSRLRPQLRVSWAGPWSQSDSRAPLRPRPDVRLRAHVGGERGLSSARGRRPKHCDGNPSHPAGRESNNLPPGPTRSPARGQTYAVAGARSYAELSPISDAAPGTTCGNHRANSPRHPGASQSMVSAGQAHGIGSVSWTFTSEGSLVRIQLRPPSFPS